MCTQCICSAKLGLWMAAHKFLLPKGGIERTKSTQKISPTSSAALVDYLPVPTLCGLSHTGSNLRHQVTCWGNQQQVEHPI